MTSPVRFPSVDSSGRLRPKHMPGTPKPIVVGSNGFGGGGVSTTQTTADTSRKLHTVAVDASDLRLAYTNVITSTGPDADGPGAYPIKAAVEIAGTIYRTPFGGAAALTVDPGGVAVTSPLAVEVTSGTHIYARTYLNSTSWRPNGVSYNGNTGGRATGDLTNPGAAAIASGNTFMYHPAAVIGVPKNPAAKAVLVCGDSIAAGVGDGAGNPYEGSLTDGTSGGYLARALFGKAGWINVAFNGDNASNFRASHHRRMALVEYVTDVICEYGTNDVMSSGRTAAQVQADLAAIWSIATARGVRCWQTTVTPRTTDSAATVTSNATYEAQRVLLNDWLRAGAPLNATTLAPVAVGTGGALLAGQTGHPLSGVFDVTDAVETARNSGLWKAGYTTDGTHPTPTGHAALAAAVNTTALLAA